MWWVGAGKVISPHQIWRYFISNSNSVNLTRDKLTNQWRESSEVDPRTLASIIYDRGSTINHVERKILGIHLEKSKTAVDPYLTPKEKNSGSIHHWKLCLISYYWWFIENSMWIMQYMNYTLLIHCSYPMEIKINRNDGF